MNRSKLLIIGTESEATRDLGGVLHELGEVRLMYGCVPDLSAVRSDLPDIVLLDAAAGMDALEVCKMMKADPALRDLPVIILVANVDPDFELAGFRLGVADFVAKPVLAEPLCARVHTHLRLKAVTDELRMISKIDPLTNLATRTYFEDMLKREWSRSLRSGHSLAVAMFEVDHFDRLVERHGRRAGGDCMLAVAQAVVDVGTRAGDVTARFDDHVLAVLLPETSPTGAQGFVHRLMDRIKLLELPNAASLVSPFVTLSVGIGYHDATRRTRYGRPGTIGPMSMDLMLMSPNALQDSALLAMHAARAAGHSQAWWIDPSKSDVPELAYEAPV